MFKKTDISNLLEKIMSAATPERMITISDAVDGFFCAKRAQKLSPNTLRDYGLTLRRFIENIGKEKLINEITPLHIRRFLGSLEVSKKTVLNHYIALSSLWTWAVNDGFCPIHILRKVIPPVPEKKAIIPFTKEEVLAMLNKPGRPPIRNRALLLFLLDTGVRASEIGVLKLGDLRENYVKVYGKGDKERIVPICDRTTKALWQYLETRNNLNIKSFIFSVNGGRTLNRHTLRKWLVRLSIKVAVPDIHPHRFRHTFAVNYIRNGGDAISLQRILGHTTLDMVRHYVELANEDIVAIHHRASPVEKWEL